MDKMDSKTAERKTGLVKQGYIHLFIIFITFFLVASIFLMMAPFNKNVINSEKNKTLDHPWTYSIDNREEQIVELPYNEKQPIESKIVLSNILPDEIIKGITMLIRTSQQSVRVYVENELIYDSHDLGMLPSSAYHFVRLPIDSSHKSVMIELTSPYSLYAGRINDIFIGSKASNIFYVLGQGGWQFGIGATVFIVGLLLSTIFMFAKKHQQLVGIIYLGFFFICAGFWVMVESRLLQFVIPYPVALTNISIFALTLLPFFANLYYFSMHEHQKRPLELIFTIISTLLPLSLVILAFINPAAPVVGFRFYLIYFGIYILATSVMIFVNEVKGNRKLTIPMVGIIIFFFCGFLELFQYFTHMKEYNTSNLLTLGLFIFCIVMLSDLAINFSKAYSASIHVNALTVLAYTDSLTGLRNRTAFLESVSDIQLQDDKSYTLFMFDINNLKLVNDTLGHLIGDAMIKHSVQVILGCLRENDELYRIGGDEFVAVLKHGDEFDPNSICESMKEVLEKERMKTSIYDLNIAYGFAQYDKNLDSGLFKTFQRADENMYLCKKQQKEVLKGDDSDEK